MTKCSKCKYVCDKEMHLCPNCHNVFTSIRVAQYGGVGGGQPRGWEPGSSPQSRGMQGGAFNYSIDAGLDARMGQTRRDVDDDHFGDASMESRLHQFHKYFEDDTKPYLPYKERQKIKIYENTQRKEKFEKDTEKALFENSPAFIKEHFGPKIEHMIVLEDLLDDLRTNDEKRVDSKDDKVIVIDVDGEERVASRTILSDRVRHTTTTIFGPHEEDDSDKDSSNIGHHQFDTFPMGNAADVSPMFSSTDVDNYLQGDGLNKLNGFLDESTLAYSYPNADEVTMHGEQDKSGLPSPIPKVNSTNISTEQKLGELNNADSPDRLPNDPYRPFNLDEIRGQEGRGTKYPSKDLQLGYPAPTPYI